MLDVIRQNLDPIAEICRRHGVKRLELFGSAARDDFDPARSDVDFLVEFISNDWKQAADHWFGLIEDLQRLTGFRVDLVSAPDVWNPYFLKSANQYKVMLYAA